MVGWTSSRPWGGDVTLKRLADTECVVGKRLNIFDLRSIEESDVASIILFERRLHI